MHFSFRCRFWIHGSTISRIIQQLICFNSKTKVMCAIFETINWLFLKLRIWRTSSRDWLQKFGSCFFKCDLTKRLFSTSLETKSCWLIIVILSLPLEKSSSTTYFWKRGSFFVPSIHILDFIRHVLTIIPIVVVSFRANECFFIIQVIALLCD